MINIELETMYLNDKLDRSLFDQGKLTISQLSKNDRQRLITLKSMLYKKLIDMTEIWNLHYSALILQHSNTTSDFKLAHRFAKKAVKMGSNATKWLYAATLDRMLVSQGKKQKFGTQYQILQGRKVYAPTDGTISAETKIEYGVIRE